MPTKTEYGWTNMTIPNQFVNWTAISANAERMIAGTFEFNKKGEWRTHTTFCYDRKGNELWKDELLNSHDGIFWVAMSADGNYAASGGNRGIYDGADPSKSIINGFIRAYDVNTFNPQTKTGELLDETTASRVNCVALSDDGTWLIAGSGDKEQHESLVCLFKLEDTASGKKYVKQDTFAVLGGDVGSVAISADGMWIVAGMSGSTHLEENVSSTAGQAGMVAELRLFRNVEKDDKAKLLEEARWQDKKDCQVYVQMVRITPDAKWIAASSQHGTIYLFERESFMKSKKPVWTYRTKDLKNVYGVSISDDGQFIAAAANISTEKGGLIYLFKSVKSGRGYRASVVWTSKTTRSPNPGVTMDANAKFITAADGYPIGTKGHLSIFSREPLFAAKKMKSKKKLKKGTKPLPTVKPFFSIETPDMCWPMTISADGTGIIAGDDDGNVYFFEMSDVIPTLQD